MRIGWIGTGVMGASMAGHLLDAGHRVTVHTRTRARADALVSRGATWAGSPAAAADGADLVGIMVGVPADVAAVALGDEGAIAHLGAGALLIDFTTSDPALAVELAAAGALRQVGVLDAPVSGGDVGARAGTLSIMVGGDPAVFERARPMLGTMGGTIVWQGPAGSGQHTKLVNQILIAGTMMGLCEALIYARAAGLDAATVLESVGGGAAASWSLANLAPRILADDLAPGFFVDHFVKDLGLALDHAARMQLDLPTLALARELYASLSAEGGGRNGTQALVVELARRSGLSWP
jgi:3-hydroxyisobutyrate dehydrogenase